MEEKEEKEEKKKKEKYRRRRWWKKCKERIVSLITVRRKEDEKEKECRKRDGRPRARHALGKSGRWPFLLLLLEQKWLVCQRCSGRTAEKDGDDGKDAAGSSGKKGADARRRLHKGGGSQKEKTGLK